MNYEDIWKNFTKSCIDHSFFIYSLKMGRLSEDMKDFLLDTLLIK